jgi:hypothetical protein
MRDWLFRLRRFAGHDDRAAAYRTEARSLEAALAMPKVDPRFEAHMKELTPDASIRIGSSHADPDLPARLPLADIAGHGHALVLGGNGTGKTRVVAGVVRELLARTAAGQKAPGIWLADHKSEFVPLAREILAEILERLPAPAANRLIDKLVVVNPFASDALVPMNVLHRELGVGAEEQAYDVTSLIDRLGGADLGIRQDSFTFHLVLLGVSRPGMSLVDLARLAGDPVALVSAAAASPSPEVRAYFTEGARIAQGSLDGVRARLHRLLRLPATRLMLGAKDSLAFKQLLAERIVCVDTGSPPLGCEDIGRFWSTFCTLRLSRAIFARRHEDAERDVAVFIDEWQEGLAGGGGIADNYERILSMARSRGVSLWLISQSLAGAAKVSASLPKMVATNTNLQLLFRCSIEDARTLTHLLPITGRRPRPPASPWEGPPKTPFLTASEELQALVAEAAALPDRVFYLWNRRRPYRAELVRAADVTVEVPAFRSMALSRRLEHGSLARPVAELEAETAKDMGQGGFRPLLPVQEGAEGPARIARRPRAPRR